MNLAELHWTTQSSYPILATLQLLPLLAIALLLALRGRAAVYPVAIGLAVTELLLAFDLYRHFDTAEAAMQLAEELSLLPVLGYHAAVDGMSVLFILLTAVLSLLVVLYAKVRKLADSATFLAMVFAIEATLQGMFVTLDLLWFTLLSAVELLLIAYLLQRWAKAPQDDMAMGRYLQFMGIGLLLLFAGVFMLGWNHADATGGQWSFDLHDLTMIPVPVEIQSVIFFLLFYGLGIRIPLFPLHGWLPLVAEYGTIAVAGIFLLGLKTGIYGLVRFVLPLLSEAVLRWHDWVVAFALAGIFYAAILALMQVNLRRMLAFSSLSHVGLVLLGIASFNLQGIQGALFQLLNFSIVAGGIFLLTGFLHHRVGSTDIISLGGAAGSMPLLAAFYFLFGLASMGIPGTSGFPAEFLLILSALDTHTGAGLAALAGLVLGAAYFLGIYRRAFLGQAHNAAVSDAIDLRARELGVIVVMAILILIGGFYPNSVLELTRVASENWVAILPEK